MNATSVHVPLHRIYFRWNLSVSRPSPRPLPRPGRAAERSDSIHPSYHALRNKQVTPHSQLGPYRIASMLGAGGMGEVYRATDTRLGRDVAVKILPGDLTLDAERLRRFEQEARAAGALNHPNILSIFDVGREDGRPYVVAELLEGETLRDRLVEGRLPLRKSIDYATQLADGLAAAHDRGIVHRDLKPENIFLTKDGRLKILDFGLARITTPLVGDAAGATDVPTTPVGTDPGVVLGTVGYMSPEQVRGKPADLRSDIFAFGTVFYEMVCGQRAFRRDSAVETMNAILKEEPAEISSIERGVPPAIERIITHCLEKQPEARFQSAHDIAFSLRTLSEITSSKTAAIAAPKRVPRNAIAIVAALLIGAAVALLATNRFASAKPATYKRLTFRRGDVDAARFAPGGSIVYGSDFGGAPDLYAMTPPATDARPLGVTGNTLLSISKNGEVALLHDARFVKPFTFAGTLSIVPLGGGTPRDIAENVQDAAWDPAGKDFAIVRSQSSGGADQIEYPPGTVLYRAVGRADYIRFSPDGTHLAFIDHPAISSDGGTIAIIDLKGTKRDLTRDWSSARGVAWKSNNEIWFTASGTGAQRALHAVTLGGKERLLAGVPASLVLCDVDENGRALLALYEERMGIVARTANDKQERDLSWLDWGRLRDINADGSQVLFDESGEGGGDDGKVFLRSTSGAPAVRLSSGTAGSISPDGKSIVALVDSELVQVPIGAGQTRALTHERVRHPWGALLPDNRRFVMASFEKGGGRFYVANLDGSGKRPISPPAVNVRHATVSPDGKWLGARDATPRPALYPIDGGAPRVFGERDEVVVGFSADSRYAFVSRQDVPIVVSRVEIATGRREPWMTVAPALLPSTASLASFRIAADGKSYAYHYVDSVSTLYLAEGLR
jgi:eukaryotic-like serine/threonine-protein kinase